MKRRWLWLLAAILIVLPLFGPDGIGVSAEDDGTPVVTETPTEVPTDVPTEIPTETPTETVVPTDTATEVPTPTETSVATETPTVTATATPTATDTPQANQSEFPITLSCGTNPETIRIQSQSLYPITVYDMYSWQYVNLAHGWFTLNRVLNAGETWNFQSGPAAKTGNVLTTDELFVPKVDVYNRGIMFRTSIGSFGAPCLDSENPTPTATPIPHVNLRVTVSCRTNPETIRIDNVGTTTATITTITSLLTPAGTEPYTVNRKLGAGKTVIFRSGSNATSGTVLTTRDVFDNSGYDREGVRIRTASGQTFTDKCDPNPATPTPTATPAVYPSLLQVSVNCKGTPETVTVKNVGKGTVTITAVGSLYQPLSGEPYRVTRTLKPGASITFQSGSGAVTNRLTALYIFNNNVGSTEGVRVVVSTGKTFVTRCS